jgi:hypothetical protein
MLLKTASFNPKALNFPDSWIGHLPLASFLMQELTPKIFVELGTHSGNSYFSFCQSVYENKINTRCYAVDTWLGDEHSGSYDEEFYQKVKDHNDENYSSFSTLLKMTFNEALDKFEDGSVDLLHIDGLHTYEAVKYDYESWLPKMSPDGVIVFHDTQVFERNFGVNKLWKELLEIYPNNIEFLHCNGLGVLQLNSVGLNKKLNWLEQSVDKKNELVKYFSALGDAASCKYKLKDLNSSLLASQSQVQSFQSQVQSFQSQVQSFQSQVQSLNSSLLASQSQVQSLNHQLNNVYMSKSWRITSPLRLISRELRAIFRSFN